MAIRCEWAWAPSGGCHLESRRAVRRAFRRQALYIFLTVSGASLVASICARAKTLRRKFGVHIHYVSCCRHYCVRCGISPPRTREVTAPFSWPCADKKLARKNYKRLSLVTEHTIPSRVESVHLENRSLPLVFAVVHPSSSRRRHGLCVVSNLESEREKRSRLRWRDGPSG